MRDTTLACSLPMMVDADDGHGMSTASFEVMSSLVHLQSSLKTKCHQKMCGHTTGKKVVPTHMMVGKVEGATQTRLNPETFIMARTDARVSFELSSAMRRAERYLLAGADGLFIEGPRSVEELEEIDIAFRGTPMIAIMLEGGGKTHLTSIIRVASHGLSNDHIPDFHSVPSNQSCQRRSTGYSPWQATQQTLLIL